MKYKRIEVFKINGDKTKVNIAKEYFVEGTNRLNTEGLKWIYEHGYIYFNNGFRM
jgi:hypothetical protein